MIACAERLRSAVESLIVDHTSYDRSVTISLGVAERRDDTRSVDDLIKAADEALYHAKERGRNCVVFKARIEAPSHRRIA